MKLEDLTKEELITLIHRLSYPHPIERDIVSIRIDSLAAKGQAVMEQARADMSAGIAVMGLPAYMKANDLFAEGMALSQESADLFIKYFGEQPWMTQEARP